MDVLNKANTSVTCTSSMSSSIGKLREPPFASVSRMQVTRWPLPQQGACSSAGALASTGFSASALVEPPNANPPVLAVVLPKPPLVPPKHEEGAPKHEEGAPKPPDPKVPPD